MYCENCGRWLNDGEKCNCKKLEKRKQKMKKKNSYEKMTLNMNVVFSVLLFILGALCYGILYKNSSALARFPVIQDHKIDKYLICGISVVICLLGFIFGILAIKKGKWKVLSCIAMFANLFFGIALIVIMIKPEMISYNRGDKKQIVAKTEETDSEISESEEQNIIQITTNPETEEIATVVSYEETDLEKDSSFNTLASEIVGTWYRSNSITPTFVFNEDGTGTYVSKYEYKWELDDAQTLSIIYLL